MSHASARSLRIKAEARTRPDAVWRDAEGSKSVRYENTEFKQDVIRGGTELYQLVTEADAHLLAMRKIAR